MAAPAYTKKNKKISTMVHCVDLEEMPWSFGRTVCGRDYSTEDIESMPTFRAEDTENPVTCIPCSIRRQLYWVSPKES